VSYSYDEIKIGDVFESPVTSISGNTYTVMDKKDGKIEIKGSYQNPSLTEKTMWVKPDSKVFMHRIYNAFALECGK